MGSAFPVIGMETTVTLINWVTMKTAQQTANTSVCAPIIPCGKFIPFYCILTLSWESRCFSTPYSLKIPKQNL